MKTLQLDDDDLQILIDALADRYEDKRKAFETAKTLGTRFSERDFGMPQINELLKRVEAKYGEDADPNTPQWQQGSGECPLMVIYGTVTDGFKFYGPFDNQQQVNAFIDRLGFRVDECIVHTLDIPTH